MDQGEHCFFEANSFGQASKYGAISESDRERLEFDIMLGRGEVIAGTGGLKEIHCGRGGCFGKTPGWRVVFADYPEYHVTFLLLRFPEKLKASLDDKECHQLKLLKIKFDDMVRKKYG